MPWPNTRPLMADGVTTKPWLKILAVCVCGKKRVMSKSWVQVLRYTAVKRGAASVCGIVRSFIRYAPIASSEEPCQTHRGSTLRPLSLWHVCVSRVGVRWYVSRHGIKVQRSSTQQALSPFVSHNNTRAKQTHKTPKPHRYWRSVSST